MKTKFFLLSAIISACVLSIATNQSTADEMNPNMQPGQRPCYPASKCTGDPNLIGGGGSYGYSSNAPNGGPGSPSTKVLHTASQEQFVGTVKSVNRVSLPNETQIQIILSTEQGDLLVIVGPANYIDQGKVKMQAGDKITVSGYRMKANGNQVVVAAEIKKNGYALQLLDDNRMPVWGGGQGKGMPYSGTQNQNQRMPYNSY